MKSKLVPAVFIVAAVMLLASLVYLSRNHFEDEYVYEPNSSESKESAEEAQETETTGATRLEFSQDQVAELQYLVEEEKLAHDVYNYFYEMYDSRVFGNILESESTHQGRVLAVMESRNVADPRIDEAGKFTNSELQSLYNQLIEQGSKSETDAFEVGVIIEEKDVADLTRMIEASDDDEVISMMEDLKKGSENHLDAFNRQLSR